MANIFQRQITPVKPKILEAAEIYVYVPTADADGKGLASFNQRDFSSPDGHVSLKWPMRMMVEDLADPLLRPSLVKVLEGEFEHTNQATVLENPVTKQSYTTNTTEIKLKRENLDALARPELVMLNAQDFEAVQVNNYNEYKIKRRNPLEQQTIVKMDATDFKYENNLVKLKWPIANNTGRLGLMKISAEPDSSLRIDSEGNLQIDTEAFLNNFKQPISIKPTYSPDFTDINQYVEVDGLAKRNIHGNELIAINKNAVGLSNVENKHFSDWVYTDFGSTMKGTFNSKFLEKLDKTLWDGPTGLFRDWLPPTSDRNTVQKWLGRLENVDSSLLSSIQSMRVALGFYGTNTDLMAAYPASALLFGSYAYVIASGTYWAIHPILVGSYQFFFRDNSGLEDITGQVLNDVAINLSTGVEYSWNGLTWDNLGAHPEKWEWFDTTKTNLDLIDFVETDPTVLRPNAPVASVGNSGKWVHSNHEHPSDPSKLDIGIIEDAQVTITTVDSDTNDFRIKLVDTKVYDSTLTEIPATIVPSVEYLAGIENSEVGDLAITRDTNQIYTYFGLSWMSTGQTGSISYNSMSTVNIPYVKVGQYLHNWKANPTEFAQDSNSNEYYWAGTRDELDSTNLELIPNNSLLVVDEEEESLPGTILMEETIDRLGVEVLGSDKIVTTDSLVSEGLLMTIQDIPEVPGVSGSRKKLVPLTIPQSQFIEDNYDLLTLGPGDNTVTKHRFAENLVLVTNENGSIVTENIHKQNMVVTSELAEVSELNSGQLVIAKGPRAVETWSAGAVANKPLVSAGGGTGGIKVANNLLNNRLLKINGIAGLESTSFLDTNLIKTHNGAVPTPLTGGNRVVMSNVDNTVYDWYPEGAVENALVLVGDQPGRIKVKPDGNRNRVLLTGANGTLLEMAAGQFRQIISADAGGVPVWIDNPAAKTYLPQTKLDAIPSNETASTYDGGLVAVILSEPPANLDLLVDNCIYYY